MKKEPKKEWTALCRDCRWSGKRRSDQLEAKQDLDNHLKTHPAHQVRVLETGG